MTDTVADYLTRLRNACRARHKFVDIPASRVKAELSKILIEGGYIKGVKYIHDNKQGVLRIYTKYDKDMTSAITGLKRVSRPSLRVYVGANRIPRVMGGYGMAIVSTSQGIMADSECRKRSLGGELMCEVW